MKIKATGQLTQQAGAYLQFQEHEAIRNISTPWMGCLSISGFTPAPELNLNSWVERGTVRVKCPAQEHNIMPFTQPGLEPRPQIVTNLMGGGGGVTLQWTT